jgi:hypothetical protein
MDFAIYSRPRLSLRAVLAADAAIEFMIAAVLLLPASPMAAWLKLDTITSVLLGIAFLLAGVAIAFLSRNERPNLRMVSGLAAANGVGGLLGWAALIAAWSHLEPQGRATLGIVSDMALALAAAEWLWDRRSQ